MSTPLNKPTRIPKMYCIVFGHDYTISKHVTKHVKEYTCSHCRQQLTTSSSGKLVELTPKFKEINLILERIYQSKTRRLKIKQTISSIY